MTDIRVTNKHALVVGDEIIVDDFFVSARIETPHTIEVFDTAEQKTTFIATDPVYESLIDANVWSPTAYPQGLEKL